ncbi:DUF6891 domain-containing protein [Variovorax sp. GB1P17]|uniref:DUF6891 domain-containing protein n=1 Tax=Variovorax sp. GB1P17 TaxID=3443740 RepID=UPI003F48D888
MANRSYLFSIDKVPSQYSDRPDRIVGLSEWAYDIPLAYLLLISEGTRACASLSFRPNDEGAASDPPLALIGDAKGGLARLMRFLDLLATTSNAAGNAEFLAAREQAKAFLASRELGYYFLETAEIDSMSDRPFRSSIDESLANVRHYAQLVDGLTPQNIEQAIAPDGPLAGVLSERGKFEERELPTLGIGFWSEVLYLAPRTRADVPVDPTPSTPKPATSPRPSPTPSPSPAPKAASLMNRFRGWLGGAAPATTLGAKEQEDLREFVHKSVWGGFTTKADIKEDSRYYIGEREWTEGDLAFLDSLVEAEWQKKKSAEATWPEETDWDRLDFAFFRLDSSGIIAYHNAGNTQDEGWEDCNEEWRERGGKSAGLQGAVFYHGQDLDHVVKGGPLLLTFGATQDSDLTSMEVARRAVDTLQSAGFNVTMPADERQRIEVGGLDWKKRSPD